MRAEAGHMLLVGALMSEGTPKHENKRWGGGGGGEGVVGGSAKCLTGALIKWRA